MKFRYLFSLIVSIFFVHVLSAQKGEYYLTHYAPEDDKIENENYAIAEDINGQMLFANTKGILKFDGRSWQVNKTPSTVLSLSTDKKTGIIYAGCLDDFGYVEIDDNGNDTYTSVYKSENKYVSISKIVITDSFVYFKGTACLYEYSKSENKITHQWENMSDWDFEIFECNRDLFITDKHKGLFKIEKGKFHPLKTLLPKGEKIIFAPLVNGKTVFVSTDVNHYYWFDGKDFKQIHLADAEYLKNSVATDAIWVREDMVIIATNKGGCVLINPVTGKTISIINFYSGLPDNEVFAIGCDKQSGIWIAHEYGFTRLNYGLPFRSFTNYPGLEGIITGTAFYNNKVYVSTNDGLYYLDEIRDYKEVTNYVRVKIPKKEIKQETKKSGFIKAFTKLFANKKKKAIQQAKVNKEKEKRPEEKLKAVTNFELQSVKYVYKKIKGLEFKCRQLIPFKDKLLLATNKGIYEIQNNDIIKITSDDISYLYIAKDKKRFFAGTNDHKLLIYFYDGQKWSPDNTNSIEHLPEPVFNITEDKDGHIWMSMENSILKYASSLNQVENFKIKNPYSDDIHLVCSSNKLYAFVGSNAYYFDSKTNKLIKDARIIDKTNNSVHLMHAENGILWYHDGEEWNPISDILKENKNFVYLHLIQDINKIFFDKELNTLSIITKDNGLYHLDMSQATVIENVWNVFLRSVKDNDGKELEINRIEISQNSGNISFSFVRPEYLDSKSQQYSYILSGFYDNWSAWSPESDITFGYLPSGSYTLIVRTKNALEQITESKPLLFEVKPPYWQEWWFYLGEFIFFGSLLGLSIWLNGSGKKNQWITRGLTFLTIVMMIEFVNTVFESFLVVKDSPVLSFLVQVFLAIMIFPFERILSILITRDHKTILLNLAIKAKNAFLPKSAINRKTDEIKLKKQWPSLLESNS